MIVCVFRVPFLLFLTALAVPAQSARFLVLFGGADEAPADWSGSISCEGGAARITAMHHFNPQETFTSSGWRAASQVDGSLSLLPQEAAVFPKTKWKGVIIDLEGPDRAIIRLETVQGRAEFRAGEVRYLEPHRLLDGRIRVERMPRTEPMADHSSNDDYPALAAGPDGRIWTAWVAHREGLERILARWSADGRAWSAPQAVTPEPGDYYQPAIVSPGPDSLLVVWPAAVRGVVDLYSRSYRNGAWSAVEKLTDSPGPDTAPRLAAAPDGRVFLVWQSPGRGRTDISLKIFSDGRWSDEIKVTEHPASDWDPAVAVNSRGEAAIAWDSYRHGNYDIFLRRYAGSKLGPVERITASPDFEARPSLTYDRRDRLWIAYDNGGPDWGKDRHGIAGLLRAEGGLYSQRKVQVLVLDRGRLFQAALPLDEKLPGRPILGSRMTLGQPSSYETFAELPVLAADGRGRVWAIVRMRTIGRYNPPERESRGLLPYWTTMATMFDGRGWSEPVRIPYSDGRTDQRAAVTADSNGDLWVGVPGDGWSVPRGDARFGVYDLHVGKIETERTAAGVPDTEFLIGSTGLSAPATVPDAEPSLEVPVWKTYRMEAGGKSYRVVWGDLHRHTDLSFDGQADGSMSDAYRYAIDAADMDFLGPSDHLLPEDDLSNYVWRMIDKAVDFYKLPGFFYPLLNYERTVAYPDGHRNIVSRSRGFQPIRIKPGDGPAPGVADDDQLMLWNRLLGGKQRPDGISIPHTTATQMGTDWRYNNQKVERLVEMYQGNRDSYEYYGAPRAAVAERIVVGGYITSGEIKEKGYIWNALAKGYKMGFIASSDHRTTHMSYAGVYVPERDYGSIWDSLYDRRTFAATDNIIVDFQCEGHAMGEEFSSSQPPRLDVRVIGTGKIRQVDIVKNNTFVYTAHPGVREVAFSYTDRAVEPGEHYYYVRVIQEDDNMAWASPIWITYRPQ
jgi:hypothetical protein